MAVAGVKRVLLERPFFMLLAALVGIFFMVPILGGGSRTPIGLDLLFSLVLVAGVPAAKRRGPQLWVSGGLGLLAFATRWAVYVTPDALAPMLVANLAFFGFTAVAVFSTVARQDEISADTISGGICVYLLIGVVWAALFQLVELLEPGSFRLPDGAAGPSIRDLLYFSVVTMTTLGYGDITPISPAARSLASGEAVVGQLYVAIFVARLVGLYTAQQSGRGRSNS